MSGLKVSHRFECLLAIEGDRYGAIVDLEQHPEAFGCVAIVIDDQNTPVVGQGGACAAVFRAWLG